MRILFLIVSLAFFYHSVAETEQNQQDEKTQTSTEKKQTEPKQKASSKTPDTFNPSEKLSQDVPTAFPVDI